MRHAQSPGLLTIGGIVYAVGLIWRLAGDDEDLHPQARRIARQEGFDFVLPIPPEDGRLYAQFGLARRDNGHRWRMRSAAGMLVQRGGSLAGAFAIPHDKSLFWVVVIREGLVMADRLHDPDTARGRLIEAAAAAHNLRIFAPADWALPGATEIDLPLLFGDAETRLAVRLGFAKRQEKLLAASCLATALGGASALLPPLWLALFPAPKPAPVVAPAPERVWEAAPKPAAWLKSCRSGMARLPAALQGWKFSGAVCEQDRITVEWERSPGALGFVPSALVIDAGAQRARMGLRLTPPPARGREELWDRNRLTSWLLARAPDASWTERSSAPVDSRPAGSAAPRQEAAPWKFREIVFAAPKDWLAAIARLDALPGAVMTRVMLTESGLKIEGVIYELG